MAELGKIQRPDVEQFRGKRKIYLVSLLFSWEGAPAEYLEKFNRYWQQVNEHVVNLEEKVGKVSHIYHETISLAGEEGMRLLEKLNPAASQIARERFHAGANLEAVEDAELVAESMDWERQLLTGFISQKVGRIVSEFFSLVSSERYKYIARQIDETLKDGEAALLIIREGHAVQFPEDIEVFMVAPPIADEILRWLREQNSMEKKEAPE